jgi:dihydroorotate dehydrogenase
VINFYKYLKPFVFKTDPEKAHCLALKTIKHNYIFDYSIQEYMKTYFSQNICGIQFDSPVGLAAGFDKNGELTGKIHLNGFGFAEIGTITPFPQAGNDKPRMFRAIEDEGLINRLGFNNKGIDALISNVRNNYEDKKIPIGINIGPNKNSQSFINDYEILIEKAYENKDLFDYITINISSPNTPGLRDLQQIDSLRNLLSQINNKIEKINSEKPLPIFLKISPDINEDDMTDIVHLSIEKKLSGLIVSNTTIDKSHISSQFQNEMGGLSGKPLFQKSTELLRQIYKQSEKKIVLIGVGGISSGQDCIEKIKAGASLVQLYTGMIYNGLFLADKINKELIEIFQREGIKHISELRN